MAILVYPLTHPTTSRPVTIDAAAYIGCRLWGWPWAIMGTVFSILPSFLLMLALTVLHW